MKKIFFLSALGAALLLGTAAANPAPTITVECDLPGARINPGMWGVFFEDINFAADGGLYAELIKNRGFEFPDPWMGWSKIIQTNGSGSVEMRDYDPFDAANPHYLRIRTGFFSKGLGVSNEGFRGIGVHDGASYNFSVEARAVAGKPILRIELVSGDGRKLASTRITRFSFRWKKYTELLRARATEPRAHLNLIIEGPGTLELDMVSLFPADTWKHRANGLRADLVQMLADLKPGFVRFPGGCIVEGRDLANRYEWKSTILDTADRPLKMNRWNVEKKDRPAPDYFQSFGLGFFEYFQLCEDIGAEPLPVLNCGMACQFNSGELAPLSRLDPFIQDALDLVEFANGPVKSEWGARRAAMGHPAPFHLKHLAIGNEQWGSSYVERFAMFAQALKRQHPEIQLVADSGPDPEGERFAFLWSRLRELQTDFVDEHFYRPTEWFLNNAGRYDHYSRTGPKVLVGEYAARTPSRANNLQSALAEAAMMTGFERNADVVRMACYAPLFGHIDAWQARPNLIWFDNLRAFGTPNYYAQQLFSRNRGDVILPVRVDGYATEPGGHPALFASATRDEDAGEIILKVVNVSPVPVQAALRYDAAEPARVKGLETVLASGGLADENSIEAPNRVVPITRKVAMTLPDSGHVFPPISLTVLRVRVKR